MAAGILETRRRLTAVLAAGVAGSPGPMAEDVGAATPPRCGP